MSGFTLPCTTCQTRLRVRDARAIGQILPCPRCGSMVLIDGASLVAGAISLGPANSLGPAKSPDPTNSSRPDFSDMPSQNPSAGSFESEDVTTALEHNAVAATESTETAVSKVASDSHTSLLHADRMPVSAGATRNLLMISAGALAGLGLALGIARIYIAARPASALAENTPGVALTPRDASANANPTTTSPPPQSLKTSDSPTLVLKPIVDGVDAVHSDPNETQTGHESANNAQPSEERSVGNSTASDIYSSLVEPTAVEAPNATDVIAETHAAGNASALATQIETNRPSGLAGFASLLETVAVAPLLPTATESADETNQENGANESDSGNETPELELTADESVPPSPTPQPRTVDIPARLKDRLRAANFQRVALSSFVRSLSRMTSIPIVFDHDSLLFVSYQTPITVQAADLTVEQLLDRALSSAKLTHRVLDDHVLITSAAFADVAAKRITYQVTDLASTARELTELESWIRRFVEPAAWATGQGSGNSTEPHNGQLVVTCNRRLHLQVLTFLESLRMVRELPFSSKSGDKLVAQRPAWLDVQDRLMHATSVNAWHPTALIAVIGEIEEHNRLTILVDWHSLARLGILPDTEVTAVARSQPLRQIIDDLLQPLGLTYVVVDGHTIQITVPEQARNLRRVEFYKERKSSFMQVLETAVAKSDAYFVVDPTSQAVIVSASDAVHQQLTSE